MLAKRMSSLESSGIRKIFELASKMKDPVNLSLGQADFDVPKKAADAAIAAILEGTNSYSVTSGFPVLLDALSNEMSKEGLSPESFIATCGAEGALVLSMLALAEESTDVMVTDPCFATYGHLIRLAGANPCWVDTYPDFKLTPERVKNAYNDRCKILLFNSPTNPTGMSYTAEEIEALANTAKDLGLQVISDEVYERFSYDYPHECFAKYDKNALVIRAFSKTWGAAGWRIGFAFGPSEIVDAMSMLQQFTFVCAPTPFQMAAAKAVDVDMSQQISDYRKKRDFVYESLSGTFEMIKPKGAFYAFCKVPDGDMESFMKRCIEDEVLVVPGAAFSNRNTHFRISFAADDVVLKRGMDKLLKLAR